MCNCSSLKIKVLGPLGQFHNYRMISNVADHQNYIKIKLGICILKQKLNIRIYNLRPKTLT